MPVIPQQSLDHIDRFLLACQTQATAQHKTQIASVSVVVDFVDPLAVLQALGEPRQRHFYFENSDQKTAILAIGTALKLEAHGKDRFELIRTFIQNSTADIQQAGNLGADFSGPHWFCNFSFFDHSPDKIGAAFPSGAVFLPRWQVAQRGDRCTVVANLAIAPDTNLAATLQQLHHQIEAMQVMQVKLPHPAADRHLTYDTVASTHRFEQAVVAALNGISDRQLHKVVLAQALDVVSPQAFNLVASLHNLRQHYPSCYIFSSSFGPDPTFLGASPERLVSVHNHHLSADALAGSAPRGLTPAKDARLAERLLSNPKEMHEHQVVIDFILGHLTALGVEPQRSPARLLQLENIQHLQTPIWARLPPHIHLLDVVAALHPTPAVAGAPRDLACEQIRHYEAFDRSLYAAPIGWVDAQGNGEFAVGIRSAQLEGCRARLFAGAGIVAGSTPERELAEVELKLQALLTALV